MTRSKRENHMAKRTKKAKAKTKRRKTTKARRATPAFRSPPTSNDEVSFSRCEHGADELAQPTMRGLRAIKVPKQGDWRIARSLEVLRSQINLLAPKRNMKSDGGIGDMAHWKKGSRSDHNPWIMEGKKGVVTARDFTHDKAGGCDCNVLVASLLAAKDARLKYIIWNSHIYNSAPTGGKPAWAKRAYSGKNPHNKHVHISVKSTKANYDGTDKWKIKL
jgi:hypothetical protein